MGEWNGGEAWMRCVISSSLCALNLG